MLAIDELPSLVRAAPELPSVLQKLLDGRKRPTPVVLAGSSQRMMHGLVLDGAAPLYGRARRARGLASRAWVRRARGAVGGKPA